MKTNNNNNNNNKENIARETKTLDILETEQYSRGIQGKKQK